MCVELSKNLAKVFMVPIFAALLGACSGTTQFSESQKRFEKEAKTYCPDIEAARTWDEWELARYPLRLAQSTLGLLPNEVTDVLNKVCPEGGKVGEKLARAECAVDTLSSACKSIRD
jgi:hypothetical protein